MATNYKQADKKNILNLTYGEDYPSYSSRVEKTYTIKQEQKTFKIYNMLVDMCIREGLKAEIWLNGKKIFDAKSYHEQFGQ